MTGTIPELVPHEPLGPGRTVVEASAGTGKTYTIAGQVARLVAVEGVPLDRILVVTFTRAATAELRRRIRGRLREALGVVTGRRSPGNDPYLAAIRAEGDPAVGARLRGALSSFDRASITTIHGLAERLLRLLGVFATRLPGVGPAAVDELLLDGVAADLLVARYAAGPGGAPLSIGELREIGEVVVGNLDARIVPDPTEVAGLPRARAELAAAMRTEVLRRLRLTDGATFDDALDEVRRALDDPVVGAAVRAHLGRRYDVGFVDESQDTDPIQWDVLRGLLGEARLVVIGDPKQSIYAFRGADVETYLAAAADADRRRTLTTNRRSDGPLVAALDLLFAGTTFGDPRIVHRPVRPAPGRDEPRIRGVAAPLVVRTVGDDVDLPRRRRGTGFRAEPLRRFVADDVAAEVVKLLTSGVTVDEEDEKEKVRVRALRPGDVAVLCGTRQQIALVRSALADRGVPSVTARSEGIFTTPAAEQWRWFLAGVERPDLGGRVRLAAASILVGLRPQEIAGLDEEEVLALQARLRRWQRLLEEEGVPAVVRDLEATTDLSARVAAGEDGERTITDLRHVAEELHLAWRRRRVGSLADWLAATIAEAGRRARRRLDEPDTRQRRLETDADAVQVHTVHGAKGLQWPVVLVPYAWQAPNSRPPKVPVFHGDEPDRPGAPRPRLVDVGGPEAPGFDEHARRARDEAAGEAERALYVALTRPQHHLVVWWVPGATDAVRSKLGRLLDAAGGPEHLAAASGGTIHLEAVPATPARDPYVPDEPPTVELRAAPFDRPVDAVWRRASFSSWTPDEPLAAVEPGDAGFRDDEPFVDDPAPEPAGADLPMADLPRGARFGTLVHRILEVLPFGRDDLEAAAAAIVADELRRGGWEELDPAALTEAILAVAATPLGVDAPSLRELDGRRMLHELVFELPVRHRGRPVSLAEVGRVMADHLPPDDPYRPYADRLLEGPDRPFRGYLTGAIDLVTVLEGRWVVVDYKTNTLPVRGERPHPLDYGPEPLAAAMIDGDYVLQATLYQVALHRYLTWRLPGYDPEAHLGGSRYLFLRGMVGVDTPIVDGTPCGIARWEPPPSMIVALSERFAEDGAR